MSGLVGNSQRHILLCPGSFIILTFWDLVDSPLQKNISARAQQMLQRRLVNSHLRSECTFAQPDQSSLSADSSVGQTVCLMTSYIPLPYWVVKKYQYKTLQCIWGAWLSLAVEQIWRVLKNNWRIIFSLVIQHILWVFIRINSNGYPQHTCMFLWRNKQNCPLIILRYPPYLSCWSWLSVT